MDKISACIICFNERENIRACLESVRGLDEIVVVDSHSTDGTPDICREFTGNIHQREWKGFSDAKNFCIGKSSNEWVLIIDADERLTPQLLSEIRGLDGSFDGYLVPRKNFFAGRWIRHGGWYPDYTMRLFRKSKAAFPERQVHEAARVEGRTARLQNPLEHYTYRDISDYVRRLDRYSTLAAGEIAGASGDPKRNFFPDILFRPPAAFLKMYLLRLGFLDGLDGLVIAALSAFYTLAKYAKAQEAVRMRQ